MWVVMEFVFSGRERSVREIATLTTLSNGFLSVRGDPEVAKSDLGTFVSGIYCYAPVFYRELVNLPRITPVYLSIDGEPFRPLYSETLVRLDALNGVVHFESILASSAGRLEYRSLRIVHKNYKGIFAQKFSVKPIDFSGRICIRAPIETSVCNRSALPEVHVRLFKVVEAASSGQPYLHVRTPDDAYDVYFKMLFELNRARVRNYVDETEVGSVTCIDVIPGEVASGVKKVIVAKSRETLERDSKIAEAKSFEELLETHKCSWQDEWRQLGLSIKGDEEFARYLYFNTFHLLQLYDELSDAFLLPARGLHGYGYRGHVFWDADIYSLPFYLFFKPSAAKALLKYRCRCLPAAIEYAARSSFGGARFPWESTDDCHEATPREVPLNLAGTEKVLIETGELELHITADVAYAVDLYYTFSGDDEFMVECGLRMIFETARFWCSRVQYDPKKDSYVIRDVIGPDEYHVHVDNNFYTNLMVKHNLELGVKYFEASRRKSDWWKIAGSLVSEEEVSRWREIARKMYLPCLPNGLCEEFDGYFKLIDCTVPQDCIGERCLPEEVRGNIRGSRLVKQADVLAGMFLLREKFSKETIALNYDFYFPRTTHASSLSLPMHAAVLAYIGRTGEAYRLLKLAASADLENLYGNVEDGFHVGSAAGVWAAILFGFAGLSVSNGELVIDAKGVPGVSISFTVKARNKSFSISL